MGCNQSSDFVNGKNPLGYLDANGTHNLDINVGEEVLERYLELEEEIALEEKLSPSMVLQQKKSQLGQLTIRIDEQLKRVRKLDANTSPLEEGAILKQIQSDPNTEQIKEEVAALNTQEIARNELNNLLEQRNNLDNEVRELEGKMAKLEALYTEQEDLLQQVFNGAYGSEEENRMEAALDQIEEMRNRIVEANFKWRQAQMMVEYAYRQLEFAVSQWESLATLDPENLEECYALAAETRNNLVAASQNIQGGQRYLSNIQFPYCAPSEIETLNKATAYIFTDMQTPERHEHALQCYSVTAKRCGALLQWINQVVTQTIARDLEDINARVKEASYNLRSERVRLIKMKVKEILGRDVDISANKDINTDVDIRLNMNELALTEGLDPNMLSELSSDDLAALSDLSASELAPPPSMDQVFGEQMEALKKEFEEDTKRYDSQMAENQTRVMKSLEQTLAARRQRRARLNIEAKEQEVLAEQA